MTSPATNPACAGLPPPTSRETRTATRAATTIVPRCIAGTIKPLAIHLRKENRQPRAAGSYFPLIQSSREDGFSILRSFFRCQRADTRRTVSSWFDKLHLLPVVGEFLATVEAYHVRGCQS